MTPDPAILLGLEERVEAAMIVTATKALGVDICIGTS